MSQFFKCCDLPCDLGFWRKSSWPDLGRMAPIISAYPWVVQRRSTGSSNLGEACLYELTRKAFATTWFSGQLWATPKPTWSMELSCFFMVLPRTVGNWQLASFSRVFWWRNQYIRCATNPGWMRISYPGRMIQMGYVLTSPSKIQGCKLVIWCGGLFWLLTAFVFWMPLFLDSVSASDFTLNFVIIRGSFKLPRGALNYLVSS